MEIVDSHEHLPFERDRVAMPVDFSTLFSHYCRDDLGASGMSVAALNAFTNPATPLDEKWRLFEPHYRLIQDGGYCRAAQIAMERFYGHATLTSLADAEAVTDAIRKANVPGLYRNVLREACGIRLSLNYGGVDHDPEFFRPVVYVSGHCAVTKQAILDMEDRLGASCGSLPGYVDGVFRDMHHAKERGAVGFKFDSAYMRDLHFKPRTQAEAESVYNRILEEGYGWRDSAIGYDERRPLQDYLVHRVVEEAGTMGLPVVFHSGIQAAFRHNPDDSRPLRLWNLPHRYRKTRFVILHAGMPWVEDAALLAKSYSNVFLDLAWDNVISPEIATRALGNLIDTVPMNKINGFGGDYCVVEKVYGHLTLARRNIARALSAKVDAGAMPMSRAHAWAQALLVDNPIQMFALDL